MPVFNKTSRILTDTACQLLFTNYLWSRYALRNERSGLLDHRITNYSSLPVTIANFTSPIAFVI